MEQGQRPMAGPLHASLLYPSAGGIGHWLPTTGSQLGQWVSTTGSKVGHWISTAKVSSLFWACLQLILFLLLFLTWIPRGSHRRSSSSSSSPSSLTASSGTGQGQRNTAGMDRVDPYISRKFPFERICDRNRYPSGESLRADKVTILVNGFAESRIELLQSNMWEYADSPLVDAIYVLWGNTSSPRSLVEDHPGWKDNANDPYASQASTSSSGRAGTGAGGDGSATGSETVTGGGGGAGGMGVGGGIHARIHVIRQPSSSLNDRFLPRTFIRTRAVIICDDDITVDLRVLEFALHVWGENEGRIVGFFPRAHKYSLEDKSWAYTKLPDKYSIMLTKFFILNTDYLFEYTCHTPAGVKEYVDAGANCEDIAMNFVVSQRTLLGPVLVAGSPRDWGDTRNSEQDLSAVGLSARAGHKKDRGACITEFQRLWGGMELRYSYSKATPDVSEQVMCEKFGFMVHCDHRAKTRLQAQRALGMHVVHQERHYAYTTLVASADLLPPAIAFAQSLRLTGTIQDLVLMVDESAGGEIDLRDRVLLEHFDHVKKVKTIHNRYGIKGFSKLNAWLMEEYDKVVYIDVDTLVLGNLDHLFEHPEPTAVPDVYMSGKFNSGLLVLKPSKGTFDSMMARMDVLQSYNKGDQGFLNAFFSGWFEMPPEHRLPARYNAVLFFPDHYHPPAWFTVDTVHEVVGPVQMVHFANPWFKPWRLEVAGNYSQAFLARGAGKRQGAGGRGSAGTAGVGGAGDSTEGEDEDGGGQVERTGAGTTGGAAAAGVGAAGVGGKGNGPPGDTPGSMNIYCTLWLRLAHELQLNSWMPLDPSTFSLTDLLPNAADYKHPSRQPHALSRAGGASVGIPGAAPDTSQTPAPLLLSSFIAGNSTSGVPGTSQERGSATPGAKSQGQGSGALQASKGGRVGVPVALHCPLEPPEPAYIGREAFVTLITRESYFAAPVWATSYLQHHTFNSWRKTMLLVLSTVPRDLWRPYRRLFNYVKVVDPFIVDGEEMDDSFAILHAWDQRSFQKLVYVDPVALFTDNCNELLNYHPFAAVPSVFPPDMFSSKVMVIQPNATVFADLQEKLRTLQYPPDSVDRFLNAYYHNWFREPPDHRIPSNFGVDMWFKEGLMKFFVPWKVLVFDPRAPPWTDISEWMAHDRTKAVKLWRRTFCSLEDAMKPPELEYMCKDLTS